MRVCLTVISLVALALALVAKPFGYEAASAGARLWLFAGLVSVAGVVTFQRTFPWRGTADALIRTGVICLAIIVFSGLVLGAIGWLTTVSYAVLLTAFLAGSLLLKPNPGSTATISPPIVPLLAVGVCAALLILIVSYGLGHSPLTAYDSLSYHLFFPARWLQEHRLSIIPTPFSDEAQAYAPANGELYFLWLMMPLHGDLLARIGQVPFYLLIGVTLYALARRMGAKPAHAVYAALFSLVSRPMVEQAVGADVDLICWGLFLTSLYLGIAAAESDTRRDWVLWGLSVGLYLGTKYVALVYSPVLLLPLVRGPRRRMLWALPGIAALALPWYLRNLAIAGSPIYPASLTVAGVTLARGAYSRAAMLHSVFHTTDIRLFPVMAAHAFGPTLLLCWAPFAVLGAWTLATGPQRWPARHLLIALVLMVPLYWFGIPDNVDSRFLLPVAILSQLLFAFAFRANRVWNGVVHGLYALALLWIGVGLNVEIPADVPWFMGGWLLLWGLVSLKFVPLLIGLVLLGAATWRAGRGMSRPVILTGAVALGSVILTRGAETWCAPSRCDYLQTTSIFIRASFTEAWRWTDAHISGATFAYTGNNVPYPLVGPHLANHVSYVNIDRHLTWRFHDYDRAARQRGNPVNPAGLATSSGVLLPIQPAPGPVDAVRPRYERMNGDRAAWVANLAALGIDHLFVSALSAYEIDYVWHNDGGFPIEDDWARADPHVFTIVYENAQVRIYAVGLRKRAL